MSKRSELSDLKRTAHHEAGHAVVAYVYGLQPYKATIVRTDSLRGEVRIKISALTFCVAPQLSWWMLHTLAGMAAQDRYSRNSASIFNGGIDDYRSFEDHWYKLHVLTGGRCGDYGSFERLAAAVVKQYWYAVTSFADALIECRTIEGEELDDALDKVIFNDDRFTAPPEINGVCPYDPDAPLLIPGIDALEAESKALRAKMEAQPRG